MAWETRPRGGLYYTRSLRRSGRVVRLYGGRGDVGEMFAACHRQERQRRWQEQQEAREQDRRGGEAWGAVAGPLSAFCRDVEAVLGVVLTDAGYHRHERGPWRKRRKVDMQRTEMQRTEMTASVNRDLTKDLTNKDLTNRDLLAGAQAGDGSLVPEVRARLKSGRLMSRPLGDVARDKALAAMFGRDLVAQEDFKNQMAHVRQAAAGPSPSPLEEMLAEQVSLCWLWVRYAECAWAQALEEGGLTAKAGQAWEARLCSTQKRYVSALKALAQVRRLQVPILEFHLGK